MNIRKFYLVPLVSGVFLSFANASNNGQFEEVSSDEYQSFVFGQDLDSAVLDLDVLDFDSIWNCDSSSVDDIETNVSLLKASDDLIDLDKYFKDLTVPSLFDDLYDENLELCNVEDLDPSIFFESPNDLDELFKDIDMMIKRSNVEDLLQQRKIMMSKRANVENLIQGRKRQINTAHTLLELNERARNILDELDYNDPAVQLLFGSKRHRNDYQDEFAPDPNDRDHKRTK